MNTTTETFTYWATEMISILEGEQLEHARWFARVNSVLVSISKPMTSLYSTKSILQTPQNLTTWTTQHGEEDVNNGIAMITSYIHSHWRPSWHAVAGSLRPQMGVLGDGFRLPLVPSAVKAVDRHSTGPSPDAKEVEHTPVKGVSTIIQGPLTKMTLSTDQYKPLVPF